MSLDQFYTKPDIAQECYTILKQHVNIDEFDYIVEPSAGKGAFFSLLDKTKRIGLDVEPKNELIIKKDYFKYNPQSVGKYLVIGNPPFGKISSLAIKFFNKSSEYADVIAFIVPRTFKRVSVQNQLNMNFYLTYNEDLPTKPCCFEPPMSAKCCFQIWTKNSDEARKPVKYDKTHPDFAFVKLGPKDKNNQPTPPTDVDFVIKAYGTNCGTIKDTNLNILRPKSWHWIKAHINVEELKNKFKSIDYSMSKDTVRQDSIGQQELIHLYKSSNTLSN